MLRRHLVAAFLAVVLASPASALITGGGDEKMQVGGLPSGSLELANLETRIAWWEGPPYGGGQYHFEYSGETADLQKAIDLFAKVDSNRKHIVVRAGQQHSFWLSIGDKSKKHPIDWQFVVWIPGNWQHLSNARVGLLPPGEEGDIPMTTLVVGVTDRIDWEAIRIPDEIDVVDERLEANGLSPDQGAALKGTVVDASGEPISGATITVGRDESKKQGTSDEKGAFLITKITAGTHQITVAAEGFASKDVYYHEFTGTSFRKMNLWLAKATRVRVRVVDHESQPLSGVDVMVRNCRDREGNHYRIVGNPQFKSDDKGEFVVDDVPDGKIKFSSRTRGFYYNSVLNEHDTNEAPILLKFLPTGDVTISVVSNDGQAITSKYMVEIHEKGVDPIKGGKVGSWGGSANIGADGTYTFKGVPPGDYVVTGKPNPGRTNDRTDGVKVTIKGTDTHEIKLTAK